MWNIRFMKHTPGPWKFELETKTIRSCPANYWLASIDSWDGAVDHEANAKLIAAAPELLEAIEQMYWKAFKLIGEVKDLPQGKAEEWNQYLDIATKAIDKATT